tara:strand:+ start:365 stop:640 length:276 start_codon:yes stop_codon:yes gene_type:complete
MPEIRKVTIDLSRTINVGNYESVRGGAATEFGLTSADLTEKGRCISKPAMKQMLKEASRIASIAAEQAITDYRTKNQERDRVVAKFHQEKR